MTVEITIGDVIRPPSFKNVHQLDVEFMHGDADGETHRQVHYYESDLDELKQTLGAIAYLAREHDGDMEEYYELVDFYKSIGLSAAEAETAKDNFRDTFYEGDITCEGRAAALAGVEVTFYDENGQQREVSVSVDGRSL